MNSLVLVAFVLSVTFTTTQSLSCIPCKDSQCTPVAKLNCQGGLKMGVCGCCKVCAKIKGEKCGGIWDHFGKCDDGLTCVSDTKDSTGYYANFGYQAPGRCQSKNVGE